LGFVGVGSAGAAGLCAKYDSDTHTSSSVTVTLIVNSAPCQVTLVSYQSTSAGHTNEQFDTETFTTLGPHTLTVPLTCGTDNQIDLMLGTPPPNASTDLHAFAIQGPTCPTTPPTTPPTTTPPTTTPPTTTPPTTTPPTTTPPTTPGQPARAGYCDETGKFYDLLVGQDKLPPYDKLNLRPADVNPQTGAIYCAPPTVTTLATAPVATPPVTTAPPVKAGVAGVKKTVVKKVVRHPVVKKVVKRNSILKAKVKGAKLPFTK
jgi:hypothetical protein